MGDNQNLCHGLEAIGLKAIGLKTIDPGNVVKAIRGEPIGTLVCAQEP